MSKFKIFCDGSSSKFGSAYCLILKGGGTGKGRKNKISKTFEQRYNVLEIEFLAILGALNKLLELPNHRVTIISDSVSAIAIVSKKMIAPKFLEPLVLEFDKLTEELNKDEKKVNYLWVSRDQNLAGRYLEERLGKLKKLSRNATNFRSKYGKKK